MPAARVIEVSVPEGPNVTVRLCHQLALECEELHPLFHKQVGPSGEEEHKLPYMEVKKKVQKSVEVCGEGGKSSLHIQAGDAPLTFQSLPH